MPRRLMSIPAQTLIRIPLKRSCLSRCSRIRRFAVLRLPAVDRNRVISIRREILEDTAAGGGLLRQFTVEEHTIGRLPGRKIFRFFPESCRRSGTYGFSRHGHFNLSHVSPFPMPPFAAKNITNYLIINAANLQVQFPGPGFRRERLTKDIYARTILTAAGLSLPETPQKPSSAGGETGCFAGRRTIRSFGADLRTIRFFYFLILISSFFILISSFY